MFRLMIIEDELWMRKGLEKMLNWSELNIHHVASAKNGQEALELMDECKPEIIITDIKMPKIDGLTMLDRLSENAEVLPKVIIISGYDDFDYAKKAIQHGVVDYILKPVDPEELKNSVMKMIKMIRQDKKESQTFTNLGLKNAIYEMLAFPSNDSNTDFIPSTFYFCVILSVRTLDKELVQSIKKDMYYVSLSVGVYQLTMIGSLNKHPLSAQIESLQKMEQDAAVGFSSIQSHINDGFFVAYKEAEQAFHAAYYQNKEHDHSYELNLNISKEEETKILQALQKGEQALVHQIMHHVLDKYDSLEQKWVIQFQLFLFLSRYLTAEQLQSPNVMMLHKFRSVFTLEDLREVYQLAFDPLIDDIIQNFRPTKTNYMLQVKEYIDSHYLDSSLSLDQVAEHLQLSPAYLSFIIKKETGTNFTSHVTMKRIESAKDLLVTSCLTMNDVSVEVGYNDVKYFLKVFKKETGMTPSRYRELYK